MEDVYEPMQIDIGDGIENDTVQEIIVNDIAGLDLDALATSYQGYAKISRLVFIADHCPLLTQDALRLAIGCVKSTSNANLYISLCEKLNTFCKSKNIRKSIDLDKKWIEDISRSAGHKTDTLESDLKNFKSNSIKESIRRGYHDLGDHHLSCGDMSLSMQCYIRARDYCTAPKHVIMMCLNVVKTSIYQKNWTNVLSYVNKAESLPELEDLSRNEQFKCTKTFFSCAAGLAYLAQKQYQMAARRFLEAKYDDCNFSDILVANNICTYGSICSLVSFDRTELHAKIISSSTFKLFLDAEPQIRDIITQFYEAKYAACLSSLEKLKNSLLLDVHLASHVNGLYTLIRNKALKQYFSPYVLADLRQMAAAFNTTVPNLENELTVLILEGYLDARIDSHNKFLYARDIDHRSAAFERALSIGKEYQRRMKALMLRSVVLKNKIVLKASSEGEYA